MKVFDLVCGRDHHFEGWFGSAEQFAAQNDAHGVRCPLCDSDEVRREPSAPRLNLGSEPAVAGAKASAEVMHAPAADEARALFARLKKLITETDDVGARFAEEARRIHYAEVPARAIRGTATDDERRELHDEGIETVRLPIPRALTETIQ